MGQHLGLSLWGYTLERSLVTDSYRKVEGFSCGAHLHVCNYGK
jgi:hypothetical protein